MSSEFLRGLFILVLLVAIVGTIIWLSLKQAEDPARMLFKWVLTAGILYLLIWKVGAIVGRGGYTGAFIGIPLTAVCGIALAIVWRHSIAALIAKPFTSLYDGGSTPPDPKPAYSIAQALQKKGKYLESVAEIRRQLAMFPTDLEGHMLLAQVEAEDLKDMTAAELTISRLCEQPGHHPRNMAFALYSLADWHLAVNRDRESAQRALNKLIELYPDSEFSLGAAQRIAHLGGPEMQIDPTERQKFVVQHGPQNLGLVNHPNAARAPEVDPRQQAVDYVKHLQQHPLDMDAREKLAVIYADEYGRLDLAADQLEQLIEQPNQPNRLIVQWLNRLADLQVRHGCDYETIRATLQRIVDRYPNLAAAENARKRIDLLKLELKGKEKTPEVKLGTYEQNIGLKPRSPRQY